MMSGDYVEIWAILLDWLCPKFYSRTSTVFVAFISPMLYAHIHPSTITAM